MGVDEGGAVERVEGGRVKDEEIERVCVRERERERERKRSRERNRERERENYRRLRGGERGDRVQVQTYNFNDVSWLASPTS